MDEKQRIWVKKRTDMLNEFLRAFYPLTEKGWEGVVMIVKSVIEEQTYNNKEVRDAFFKELERWDKFTNDKKG